MAEPPSELGAVNVSSILPLPAVAPLSVGVPGAVAEVVGVVPPPELLEPPPPQALSARPSKVRERAQAIRRAVKRGLRTDMQGPLIVI